MCMKAKQQIQRLHQPQHHCTKHPGPRSHDPGERGQTCLPGIFNDPLSLKVELKAFGKRGEVSTLKEMTQLNDMQTFIPHNPQSLTWDEGVNTISLLIILREMKNSNLKGQTCINGALQQAHICKEDAASPTIMTDSFFIIRTEDAYQERDRAAADLPGAFFHNISDKKS